MASSRAQIIAQLRQGRHKTSSPHPDEYATATSQSFDADRDAIHSTAQINDFTTEQPLPQQPYHQYQDYMSENGSEGSTDMSIELGRGVKRGARHQEDDDVSSNALFQLGGGDSLYELTATPPFRPRVPSKKADDALRRQASIRRASEALNTSAGAKRSNSLKQNNLANALDKIGAEDGTSHSNQEPATATLNNPRNTRFSRSRQTSLQNATGAAPPSAQSTPRRAATNPTVQSNSFVPPGLPDLTELVSGVRKDGTPVFNRAVKARSRFTSGSYKPIRPEHHQVQNVPVPEDEKVIYASLQVLKARVEQLEMEKSEAEKKTEEYEKNIIDLRVQLSMAQGRPDSGFGSDEERSQQKTRLQASIKSLQQQLDRTERKLSISDISTKRVTKERDELLKQIGVAYYNNEELKESHGELQAENEDLKAEIDALRKANQDLRVLMQQTEASYAEDTLHREKIEKDLRRNLEQQVRRPEVVKDTMQSFQSATGQSQRKQSGSTSRNQTERRQCEDNTLDLTGAAEDSPYGDLESRVAKAVAEARDKAFAEERGEASMQSRNAPAEQTASRAAPKQAPTERKASSHKRTVSAYQTADNSDAESTTQLDFSRDKSRAGTGKRASLPSPVKARPSAPQEEDTRDLTLLSYLDPQEIANLRKKLEEERRAEKLNRSASAPVARDNTSQPNRFQRKSSLKDLTGGFDDGTGRFSTASDKADDFARVTKSVRVQSPHSSDAFVHIPQQQQNEIETGDASILSNTSRRRRRAASAEGLTSAFILPDITLHDTKTKEGATLSNTCIAHDSRSCTLCPAGKAAPRPNPIPVTDRTVDPDITDATIRPAELPSIALAKVIKQMEDEIKHCKMQLLVQQRLYHQNDPSLSKRRRQQVIENIDSWTLKIEKLSDQVYRLYDVVEGQKQAGQIGEGKEMDVEEVEETLQSIGIDAAEIAGRVGRKAPTGIDGGFDDEELPGFSDGESEAGDGFGERRMRSEIF